MSGKVKFAFWWLGTGMVVTFLLNLGVMHAIFTIDPKYVLHINLGLIFAMWPGMVIAHTFGRDIVVEETFRTAWKLLPKWLFVVLVSILVYCVIVFVRFTYVAPPSAGTRDTDRVVKKMNLGGTAATLFFYTAQFGLLNLHLQVKKQMDAEEADQADGSAETE